VHEVHSKRPSAAMARLTPLIVTKKIFLAVNGLVCQLMVTDFYVVTPLCTWLVYKGLLSFLLIHPTSIRLLRFLPV
jgi:hypothetical protein